MVEIKGQQFNKEKFKELMLYIAKKSEKDHRFGAIKLNKILYYSDFISYRILGAAITGADYQRLEEGPAPKQLLQARRELIADNFAEVEYRAYFNGVQQRVIARRESKLSLFSAEQLRIVDEVVKELWALNGDEVSDKSHKEIGYRLAEDGETIPYISSFVSYEPLSQEQIEIGETIVDKYGCAAQTV